MYTGFGYVGSDAMLIRSSDAIICGGGHAGTLHECMVAIAEGKPIGIVDASWNTTGDLIKNIVEQSHRDHVDIVSDADPRRLVEQIIKKVRARNDSL